MKSIDTGAHVALRKNGYVILECLLDDIELATLQSICDELLAEPPDDDKSGQAHNIGRGEDRRFLRHRHKDIAALKDFVLGRDMKALASGFIGDHPYLFNEQFVVKGPRTGASFAWHQDSAYVGFDHEPYLSVWIALDDTTLENGALYVLPQDLDDGAAIVPHDWDEQGKEKIGYTGSNPGIAAVVPAGSLVIFSSLTLHCSSPNTTEKRRRAYLAQYSPQPIINPDTGAPRIFATPL